ncbi:MAG: YqaA family protein [Pseudomonadota bacterium]
MDEPRAGIFTRLYQWMIQVSRHPRAPWWLGGVSFAESSFFPLPPDLMLAPMTLARPAHATRYALITTLTSVAGGLLGYAIGYFLIESLLPWIDRWGWRANYDAVVQWYVLYGFWALIVKGITPVPYKLFTISAGAAAMPLMPFVAASCISRGFRFFLVAYLVKWGGPAAEAKLLRHIDRIGWVVTALILAAITYWAVR